mmetsp:Transcript_20284/g.49780  ORF Transcript_20284/g.49780 Transcript_20284/m.49780 type:complete len:81 (-) Transcript_20284:336-578(-)
MQSFTTRPCSLITGYVKTSGGDTKVTKGAFMDYWFDPNRPKPANTHKKVKKKSTKADVVSAFNEFKKALNTLQETCLAAF